MQGYIMDDLLNKQMEVVNTIIAILIDRIDRNIRMDGNLAHSITNCINAKNPKKTTIVILDH